MEKDALATNMIIEVWCANKLILNSWISHKDSQIGVESKSNGFESNNSFTELAWLFEPQVISFVLSKTKWSEFLSYLIYSDYNVNHNAYPTTNRQNCVEQRLQTICTGFCDSEEKKLSVFCSLQLSSFAIQITAHPCVCLLSVTAPKKSEPSKKRPLICKSYSFLTCYS